VGSLLGERLYLAPQFDNRTHNRPFRSLLHASIQPPLYAEMMERYWDALFFLGRLDELEKAILAGT
jgi:hypothetical protein